MLGDIELPKARPIYTLTLYYHAGKKARSTQGETNGYAEIQTTTTNNAVRRNMPGNDNNPRQDIDSLHDYEEIPSTRSSIHLEHDRDLQRNDNPSQMYEEIPVTAIHAEQGRVHGVVYLNDTTNNYCQSPKYFLPINYEEISNIALHSIIPDPLKDQEPGEEEEYWPMVRDGYVEVSRRPNISAVVYEVLHPKQERQHKRRTRLPQFRYNIGSYACRRYLYSSRVV